MSTPDPNHPQQPAFPWQPTGQPSQPQASADGSPAPGSWPPPVYQMQPGFEIHTQPEPLPKDLDYHLEQMTPTVWVTFVLAAINVIVYLVMIARGVSPIEPTVEDLIVWGGSLPAKNFGGEPWRFFTACFVHLGIFHIAMNTVALVILGPRVERMVGTWGFLIAYIASGLIGELASSAFNPFVVSVGASGAIFGLVGVQLAILLTQQDKQMQSSMNNAWGGMLAYVGYNLFYGFTTEGIDNAAHIGGLIGGFLCGLVISQPLNEESVEHRWWRNAVLAVAAVLTAGGGYFIAKPFGVEAGAWREAFDELIKTEEKVLAELNTALQKLGAREIKDNDFGLIVEEKVATPWKKATEKLRGSSAPRGQLGKAHNTLIQYADLRQQAYEKYVEAGRESSVAKFDEAQNILKRSMEFANSSK